MKNAIIGFFIARDGRIAFMNPEQEKLFGHVPESMKLDEVAVVHPEDRAKFLALCEEATAGSGGSLDIRLFLPRQEEGGAEVRWVHCRGSRISWAGRNATLVNMLDLTRTRELERIFIVQEKMAALGHVAAGMAHEIRNPLSGINIFVASLEQLLGQAKWMKPQYRDQAEECLRHLKTASAKIASVVGRVMAFSKPIPHTLEMVDVNRAIEDAVGISEVTLRSHKVGLTLTLSDDLPKCYADLHLLEQVVLNLITNADQAMEGMARPKRLEISSGREGDEIVIKISDSGPGIPPHLREKIFDPYFTTKRDGTGIGLSLSHRVITGHGGVISVGKSLLGGAEFRMRLPVQAQRSQE